MHYAPAYSFNILPLVLLPLRIYQTSYGTFTEDNSHYEISASFRCSDTKELCFWFFEWLQQKIFDSDKIYLQRREYNGALYKGSYSGVQWFREELYV